MEQTVKKRKQQAMETKQRIFDVTMSLIREKGIENVQIEEISRSAGVSTGLFYNYFASKAALITEAANQQSDFYYQQVKESILEGLRGQEKAEAFVEAVMEYHETRMKKEELKQIYAAFLTNSDRGESITDRKRPIYTVLEECVHEMMGDGQLPTAVSVEKTVKNLIMLIRGTIFEYLLNDENCSMKEETLHMLRSYLEGLRRIG